MDDMAAPVAPEKILSISLSESAIPSVFSKIVRGTN